MFISLFIHFNISFVHFLYINLFQLFSKATFLIWVCFSHLSVPCDIYSLFNCSFISITEHIFFIVLVLVNTSLFSLFILKIISSLKSKQNELSHFPGNAQ